jgi:hypothetical protein
MRQRSPSRFCAHFARSGSGLVLSVAAPDSDAAAVVAVAAAARTSAQSSSLISRGGGEEAYGEMSPLASRTSAGTRPNTPTHRRHLQCLAKASADVRDQTRPAGYLQRHSRREGGSVVSQHHDCHVASAQAPRRPRRQLVP